ncbi:MAG TPA: histidinol-phosphatase [Devosiaceae bacterium]|jgi:histidinol phosphatase-like enzyme (inositol monophosphatase family)
MTELQATSLADPQGLGGIPAESVLQTLLDAAAVAAAETMPRFRTSLAVENKWSTGFDPVTEADKSAETAIRHLIAARFPEHGLIGEEWEPKQTDDPCQWIIDPIDGTRAFISGVPVWGTLIGFLVEGRARAGMMAQPFTGETFIGMPGSAVLRHRGEQRDLETSNVTSLAEAKLSATSPDLFVAPHIQPKWDRLRSAVRLTRYGLDCYAYCLLAAGHLDLVVEADLKNVDIAPLVPIITNAGGVITTWDGDAPEAGGHCVAAATPELHAEALRLLRTS